LRKLLRDNSILFIPGIYNSLTARIFEEAGFKALYMSGYATSFSMLGMPDVGLITLNEMAMNAGNIAEAINVPLIADCDTGYGNAINVTRAIKEYIKGGVAGVHLEDQTFPKRCGHVGGKKLLPLKVAAGKIKAAVDTRNKYDPDFLIIARTDARGAQGGGLEEAIKRGNAYGEAGADVIFVEAPKNEDEIRHVVQEIDKPIFYNSTGLSPRLNLDRLQEIGVKMVITGGLSMRVALKEIYDFALKLKNDPLKTQLDFKEEFEKHPLGDYHSFVGFPKMEKMEKKYLPEEEQPDYNSTVGYNPEKGE